MSTDATADAASWLTLPAFILTNEESKPKTSMHIKQCLSIAKAMPIKDAQKILCAGAAVYDAENLCMW